MKELDGRTNMSLSAQPLEEYLHDLRGDMFQGDYHSKIIGISNDEELLWTLGTFATCWDLARRQIIWWHPIQVFLVVAGKVFFRGRVTTGCAITMMRGNALVFVIDLN